MLLHSTCTCTYTHSLQKHYYLTFHTRIILLTFLVVTEEVVQVPVVE